MSYSHQLIICDAIRETGWDDSTLIDILTEYIANQDDASTFNAFIAEKIQEDVDNGVMSSDGHLR